ncbi:hypothetical protein CBS147333_9215 [Penicillium roqueforti]|nr:hypothetical protein CBS147333_9215 [Penicillium roqueforti]KAI3262106.1 hypothetical protein CBS147308_9480 [Penicillium roqueforti]KAI3279620.1 hypothetical protein DTO003C3_9604 [Penicillium roqueforti]
MSPSQQPSELIYCTASVCVFPRDSANIRVAEPRTIDHNTRAQESQLFTVSSSLVLAARALNIDIAPEVPEDTAPPSVLCTKPLPTHDSWPRRFKPRSKESGEEGTG